MHDFFDTVQKFVDRDIKPHVQQWDEDAEFPKSLYAKAGELGLLGLGYPEAYGGTECSIKDRMTMTQIIASSGSGGLMAGLFSHNIAIPPLLARGSETLRQAIIPSVLTGEKIAALGITEPSGGSDVANLQTRAVKKTDAQGDYYEVSGEKTFITSGIRADWITLAVRTGEPGAKGISILMVDGHSEGIQKTKLKKMGWWMSDTAQLYFNKVRVPAHQLVGEENKGFRAIMENFNHERLMLSAASVGFAKLCLDEALAWATQRKTFGQLLIEHQVIRHKLADMRMAVQSSLAWLNHIVDRLDRGDIDSDLIADICLLKNDCTQTMQYVSDQAVQILGGMGFMRGTTSERIYRETKVMMIGGGAEEIMKELAARQLGWQTHRS